MRDSSRAAMAASLDALERMIDTLWVIAPLRSEFIDADDKDAASRISHLLHQAAIEASRLRARVCLPGVDAESIEPV